MKRTGGSNLRLSAAYLLLLAVAACGGEDAAEAPETAAAADSVPSSIANVGFMTPESVLHDRTADVYLVTNINGPPLEKDNNGFISRVSPTGEVLELNWISGGMEGATLHAPKGMAIRGDSLFVADIDSVRIFHRESGAPLGAWGVPGATLLNDMVAGPDGTLYVTDTGFRAGAGGALDPSGTDAVYRFGPNGEAQSIARGAALQNPNGLAVSPEGVIVVSFGGNQISRISPDGQQSVIATAPLGQLDGVERLEDGTLMVTGWEGFSVYRVAPDGTVTEEFEGIDAPADLGYDATRRRLLIPTFNQNTIEVRELR